MKKWILSAVCLVVFSGFAAAQNTSAVKKGKEDIRKGTIVKPGTDTTIAKETAPVKLLITAPLIATSDAPAIKGKEN